VLKSANVLRSFVEKKLGKPTVRCKPWKISLEAASACNLRCITCRHHESTFGGIMTEDVFDRVKPILAAARVVNEVGYGEPFLDKRFLDKLEYAKRAGAAVLVYSNGTLLNQRLSRRLVALQLDQITFSIDGGTRETFESIRLGADYGKVLDNVRQLHRIKLHEKSKCPLLRVNYVGMRRNVEELPGAIETLAGVGVQELVLSDMLPPTPELADECLGHFPELTGGVLQEARKTARRCGLTFIAPSSFSVPSPVQVFEKPTGNASLEDATGSRYRVDPPHRTEPSDSYPSYPCYEPWQTLYITFDGNVRPCCAMDRSFGNLRDDEIGQIWNGRQYQILRSSVNSRQPAFEECRICLLRRRVRLPLRHVLGAGVSSLAHQGFAHTARKAVKYLSEYC